ncbi:MAG: hypothetical protein ABH810_02065 [bacterium]
MNKHKIISTLALLAFLLFPYFAKAQSLTSAQVEILPQDGIIQDGYLNQTNTGFRVNVEFENGSIVDSVGLYVGSGLCPIAIDSRIWDNGLDYTLSSKTSSLAELKTLLNTCSGYEEGDHLISVKSFDGVIYEELFTTTLTSDFILPGGVFASTNAANLKVGDFLKLKFTPLDASVSSVKSKFNDRELTWIKNGSFFESSLIIQEGDGEINTKITLEDVELDDVAGNQVLINLYDIPIGFLIDGISPRLQIISPKAKVYGSDAISIKYQASGFDSIKVYLDGKLTNKLTLSDLKNGTHNLKIVATDSAGNKTIKECKFSVDLIAPEVEIGDIPETLYVGDTLTLSGKTEPEAELTLKFDENQVHSTADGDGNFSFVIDDLTAGNYDFYLTVKDLFGNTREYLLGSISVCEPPKPVKIAQAYIETDYGVSGRVSNNIGFSDKEELASAGRISSSSDERTSSNYIPWLILIGFIILSFSIASAGYYGFAYLNLSKQKKEVEEFDLSKIEKEITENSATKNVSHIIEESKSPSDSDDDDQGHDQQLRW